MQTLLELCIAAAAREMPLPVAPTPVVLSDEALVRRVYEEYIRLDKARRHVPSHHHPARHLAAMRQFAALWQPSVLVCSAPASPHRSCSCQELQLFASSLHHLELASPASYVSGLAGLTRLTCLSLRHCPQLTPGAVAAALQSLPQLLALDMCGLAAASDALANTLLGLTRLEVLQLNRTNVTDVTVDCLTYGARLHDWANKQQTAGPGANTMAGLAGTSSAHTPQVAALMPSVQAQQQQQHWPRTRIRTWHLAYTKVTGRSAELLLSCPDLALVDLRGSGVFAGQLAPLRSKFALSAPQGGVLSCTAALALAAVTLEQFVCAAAAEHACAAAASTGTPGVASSAADSFHWVNQGVGVLLGAEAEVRRTA